MKKLTIIALVATVALMASCGNRNAKNAATTEEVQTEEVVVVDNAECCGDKAECCEEKAECTAENGECTAETKCCEAEGECTAEQKAECCAAEATQG